MKQYKLIYLPLFREDLNEIVRYIATVLKNPDAAERLINDVEQAILKRLAMPESFEPYPSSRKRELPYYAIRIRNFTVFYVVRENTMEVRRIVYSRRNMTDIV